MKKGRKVIYTSPATKSIIKAYDYYESSQKDLGAYFIESLEKCIKCIADNPQIFIVFCKDYRQSKVKRFPYLVIYRIKPEEIIIENIFNTYQNPIKKIK